MIVEAKSTEGKGGDVKIGGLGFVGCEGVILEDSRMWGGER